METAIAPSLPANQCSPDHALSVTELLALLGSKWTIQIFAHLSHGPRRFSELRRCVDGVSQKVLTTTLRELERYGFVTRTVTPVIPPRVDYEITDLGREVLAPLRQIAEWAHLNRGRVEGARHAFADRETEQRAHDWSRPGTLRTASVAARG